MLELDSIDAVELWEYIADKTQVEVDIENVFDAESMQDLARTVCQQAVMSVSLQQSAASPAAGFQVCGVFGEYPEHPLSVLWKRNSVVGNCVLSAKLNAAVPSRVRPNPSAALI